MSASDLPDELWARVLELGVASSALGFRDLCCLAIASRRLGRLSLHPALWSALLSRDFPSQSQPSSSSTSTSLRRERPAAHHPARGGVGASSSAALRGSASSSPPPPAVSPPPLLSPGGAGSPPARLRASPGTGPARPHPAAACSLGGDGAVWPAERGSGGGGAREKGEVSAREGAIASAKPRNRCRARPRACRAVKRADGHGESVGSRFYRRYPFFYRSVSFEEAVGVALIHKKHS